MRIYRVIIFCFSLLFSFSQLQAINTAISMKDTSNFKEIRGIIRSTESREPVVFANIFIVGTSIGTVSNLQGEFLIKIPVRYYNGELGISSLGYKVQIIKISEIEDSRIFIELVPTPFSIGEVVIRNKNAQELIQNAKININENYKDEPAMLTTFYRETIKQNRKYVSVSEAVLDVYKSSYKKILDSDRIKIFKGRKSENTESLDTLMFKLQGGPYNTFLIDFVKHPGTVLSEDCFDMYEYKLEGIIPIEDRDAYVIIFTPKKHELNPLYEGKIYLDTETLAFVSFDVNISKDQLKEAAKSLIVRKPMSMNIEIPGANYLIKYRLVNKRWIVSYIRAEVQFKVKWKKKLFNSNYYIMSELAITDADFVNIVKHPYRISTKSQDILSDNIKNFEDPEFWGEYNIIQPDQTIEEAISKLNKILQRKELD